MNNKLSKFMMATINHLVDLVNYKDESKYPYEQPSDLFALIMLNNSCGFSRNCSVHTVCISDNDSKEKYNLVFVKGAKANDSNVFYDYYSCNNTKNLVIFLDYFKDIKTEPDDDIICGNNSYILAFRTLTEVFMISNGSIGHIQIFNTTVEGTNFRYLPSIIAGIIVNQIRPVQAFETEGIINFEYFKHVLESSNISDILVGIREGVNALLNNINNTQNVDYNDNKEDNNGFSIVGSEIEEESEGDNTEASEVDDTEVSEDSSEEEEVEESNEGNGEDK